MSETLLIAHGRVVDPARGVDGALDVLVEDGKVRAVAPNLLREGRYDRVLDASGMVVAPGLVDMHVHFREPGREADETIATGSAAAVRGGFTSVAVMPNTEPAVDDQADAEFQVLQGKRAGKARIYPIGAVTRDRKGEALSEMDGLVRGGAVAFSDDGDPVRSAEVMRCALLYAKMLGRVVIQHAEDPDLAKNGAMHAGLVSLMLGLSGKSAASEEVMVARDITLASITGGRLHIAHCSTAGSVDLVRQAKRRGLKVTCEACPHHFSLTDHAVCSFDPNFKMNPPLRTQQDLEALVEGLLDGTIDAIASDHAPHSREKKEVEFQDAPNGVIGLETMVPVSVTKLLVERGMKVARLIELLSTGPARILGLPAGTLAPGAPADVAVLDLETPYTIEPRFRSRSSNCPFVGWQVRGRAMWTVVGGRVVYDRAADDA
ncbi:MAG: dihydroorotase [Planctomycetota bacterium]|nr:dihydroorotase [Planctomycetota bacterium]